MSRDKMNFVFVYGTLKNGYGNNRILSDSTYVSNGYTKEKFSLRHSYYDRGFPVCMRPVPGELKLQVYGEIYSVSEGTLWQLDRLEGVPTLYVREKVPIFNIKTGSFMDCFIYIGNEKYWEDSVGNLCYTNEEGFFEYKEKAFAYD